MPTMRKDLHVGLAIGGVLLAVLIVWGVVVNHGKQHKAVTLDTTAPGNTGSEIPPAPPTTPGTDGSTPAPTNGGDGTPLTPGVTPGNGAISKPPVATGGTPDSPKETNWTALLAGNGPLPANSDTPGGNTPPAPLINVVDTNPKTDTTGGGSVTPPAGPTGKETIANPVETKTPGTEITPPPAGPSETHTGGSTPRTHTVQKGETFASISKAVYGEARYYDQIAQANPKINPNRLRPGTVINLPDAAEVKSSTKTEAKKPAVADSTADKPAKITPSTPIDGKNEYRVAAGDSLYKISMRLYGSGEEVDHLYELNKDVIGPDKAKLKLGMVLKIPAPPTVASATH
jgi:nucleoid-associated protein YgaU